VLYTVAKTHTMSVRTSSRSLWLWSQPHATKVAPFVDHRPVASPFSSYFLIRVHFLRNRKSPQFKIKLQFNVRFQIGRLILGDVGFRIGRLTRRKSDVSQNETSHLKSDVSQNETSHLKSDVSQNETSHLKSDVSQNETSHLDSV